MSQGIVLLGDDLENDIASANDSNPNADSHMDLNSGGISTSNLNRNADGNEGPMLPSTESQGDVSVHPVTPNKKRPPKKSGIHTGKDGDSSQHVKNKTPGKPPAKSKKDSRISTPTALREIEESRVNRAVEDQETDLATVDAPSNGTVTVANKEKSTKSSSGSGNKRKQTNPKKQTNPSNPSMVFPKRKALAKRKAQDLLTTTDKDKAGPPKKKRHNKAEQEIKNYSIGSKGNKLATKNLIPKRPFIRLCREIAEQQNILSSGTRFTEGALDALQEASEMHIVEVFKACNTFAQMKNQITVIPAHLKCLIKLKEFGTAIRML